MRAAAATTRVVLNLIRLRLKLLAGPDRLSGMEARYCRLASLDARLPKITDFRRAHDFYHRRALACHR